MKPNVSHFQEFGCDIWILDESINRSKLDPQSKKMIFVGFMDGSKVVRYYDAKNRLIKISRNVAFNEDKEPKALDIIEVPGDRNEIVLHGCTKFSFILNPILITAGAVRIIGADYTS